MESYDNDGWKGTHSICHSHYRVMQLWSFGWMFYRVYCSDLVIFSLMQLIQFWYAIYRQLFLGSQTHSTIIHNKCYFKSVITALIDRALSSPKTDKDHLVKDDLM